MKKRINHNNLLPWFTEDHGKLPAGYLKSVEKFLISYKLQATSKGGPARNVQGHKKIIDKGSRIL